MHIMQTKVGINIAYANKFCFIEYNRWFFDLLLET